MARSGMQQITVALPDGTRTYLDEIAAKNGRKLSEEVRARLDQSVVDDRFDAPTKELGRDLMTIAGLLRSGRHFIDGIEVPEARWDLDEELFASLEVAVEKWLKHVRARLKLRAASAGYEQRAVSRGEAVAQSYINLKPMLIKHRPGGDNMEEQQ